MHHARPTAPATLERKLPSHHPTPGPEGHRSVYRCLALFLLLLTPVFLGLGRADAAAPPAQAPPPRPATKPQIAVSIPPQKWLVERLAGEDVGVTVVIDASANHETYQPSDRQATEIQRADLYFAVGLPMERARWFEPIRKRLRVVDCTAGVTARELEGHSCGGEDHDHHHHGQRDPHIWTSPLTLKVQAKTMASALAELLPGREARVQERLAALEKELDALHEELAATLGPCRGKAMFVFHPAWGYFADAYGIEQIAIEQEGKTPTDAELTSLQRQARERGVKVIFVQPQISSRAADAVAKAIGGRVEAIDPLVADVPANLRKVARTIAESCR